MAPRKKDLSIRVVSIQMADGSDVNEPHNRERIARALLNLVTLPPLIRTEVNPVGAARQREWIARAMEHDRRARSGLQSGPDE